MTTLLQRFGDRIRALRLQRGLTQEQLAAMAGLHHTYINSVERAERNPGLTTVEKLARVLDMSVDELFAPSTEEPDKV